MIGEYGKYLYHLFNYKDEMSNRSHASFPGGTERQRWLRSILRDALENEGFKVYEFGRIFNDFSYHLEWWHFDYKDSLQYPVLNISFEELSK